MKKNTIGTALSVGAEELKNQKAGKAKRIVMASDVHLRGYQVARKIDNGPIGPVANFESQEEVLLDVEKQKDQAEEVVLVYEVGPLGYGLYRALQACGVPCYVCAPDSSEQKKKRRKTNAIDTRTLTSNLFNFLNGNERALQLVRVPSEEQEQARLQSRQHDQLVEERKRLGAKGNALLLSQGFGSWKNWWRPKAFSRLSQLVPGRLLELLETWVDLLRKLDEKIGRAKAALAKRCSGPRHKGAGAPSLVQLQSEDLDWGLYSNRSKIGCLAGAGHSGGNPRYPATKDLTLSTLERPAPVFALGYLKPVGRLGALVPLEAMRILHHALSHLTCRIGGCLVPLEQADN